MRDKVTVCCLTALLLAGCSSSPPPCGAQGQPCCDSVVCNAGLACLSDSCTLLGGGGGGGGGGRGNTSGSGAGGSSSGHPTGGGSGASTTPGGSSGGGGTSAPSCGGASQACCAGSSCNGSLVCQNGSCAQPASGVAGTPCSKNGDCPTGICLPVGQPPGGQPSGESPWTGDVCSTSCGSASDCVSGWSCAPLIGQSGNVCQCQYSPEICDGKDNDCNGIVDDEPEVDQACQRENVDEVCVDGSCACLPQNLCNGACVDLTTDASNCGSCGNVCAVGAGCSGGSCGCPAGDTVCAGSCTNTSTDPENCGSCGDACGSDGECLGGNCCGGVGGSCSADSDCCSGGVCFEGSCVLGPGEACQVSSACYNEFQGEVYGGYTCYPINAGQCPSGCSDGGFGYTGCTGCLCPGCTQASKCCQPIGGPCTAPSDCCFFYTVDVDACVGGQCCVPSQGYCEQNSDCCSGLSCSAGGSGTNVCQ